VRELAPHVFGAVVRRFRDFAACEDAVQEALIAAVAAWPRDGLPENPRAWLLRVGARRMTDHVRVEERADSVDLLFMCCHPTQSPSSATALTLCVVGGLTTAEIPRGFLVPEATVAQQISWAKQTIKTSGLPFEVPGAAERAARLAPSTPGPRRRRGGRAPRAHAPDRRAVRRAPARPARSSRSTSRTDPSATDAIAEGVALLTAILPRGQVGPYQLQAAIAAVHDEAPSADETDWPQILGVTASYCPPIRASRSHRLDAVRAHLLERSGDRAGAIRSFQRGGAQDQHRGAELPLDQRGPAARGACVAARHGELAGSIPCASVLSSLSSPRSPPALPKRCHSAASRGTAQLP